MSVRTSIRRFLLPFALLATGVPQAGVFSADRARPNMVLILADDVGFSDFGCFGGEIQTPHIDRLAREGMRFTHFYNNAVCVPTRASLLTGLYPRYVGTPPRIALTPQMITIAELLRDAGYHTSLSGKWHLGREAPHHPLDRGFEEFYGLLDGCCNYFNPAQRDPPFEGGRYRYWAHNRERILAFPPDFYTTDAITQHAVEQVRRFARSGGPFFVHVCYTAAHSPLHAKPEDMAKYRGRYRIGWNELRRQRHLRQKELGVVDPAWKLPVGEPEFVPWEREPLQEWNENLMVAYAAMVDCMDQGIGKILDALRDCQVEQNTLVAVLCDNGGCAEQAGGDDPTNIAGPKEHYVSCGAGWAHAQNTPFRRYKAWVHEGGIATPLVVRWPGVTPAGSLSHQVGHVFDLLPTFAEIAGAVYPATRNGQRTWPPEGESLCPILRGKPGTHARKLYWASNDNRALRQGKWKIVWDQDVRRWELYDLLADRTETNDLAAADPQRVERMARDWQAWAERTGAHHALGRRYVLKPAAPRP